MQREQYLFHIFRRVVCNNINNNNDDWRITLEFPPYLCQFSRALYAKEVEFLLIAHLVKRGLVLDTVHIPKMGVNTKIF